MGGHIGHGEEEWADGEVKGWLVAESEGENNRIAGKKGRTEMSDKKMKGTSSEPQSGSESNASSYYGSSVHRQQRVPAGV